MYVVTVCCRSCIFYRACMDVPRGTELLVWYNDSYTSFFGIPLQCIAQDENRKEKSHLAGGKEGAGGRVGIDKAFLECCESRVKKRKFLLAFLTGGDPLGPPPLPMKTDSDRSSSLHYGIQR